jgi:hypothetical protein
MLSAAEFFQQLQKMFGQFGRKPLPGVSNIAIDLISFGQKI